MALKNLIDALPDYAEDVKTNLSRIVEEDTLTPAQLYGTLLATALAARNPVVIREIEEECRAHLSPADIKGAKAAHAIMAQNNTYYRFYGMVRDDEYRGMQSGLQMNIIADPGVDKHDFELWSLAVSIINSCKYCVDVHDKKLRHGTMEKEHIWTAARIAAVMHSVSVVLAGETALV
ncbi:MAG: carboxymuconolactone decarboxylase family protein [Rhodospirillales bacterium]|nr:carboxymuconolactone decarboxylase family protein [Rhodospirillales bacterium]